MPIDETLEVNQITKEIIDGAFKVHKHFGPGLLENVYEQFLCIELKKRNIAFERQKEISVTYENETVNTGFRLDLIIENKVIVELKTVEKILPVHQAQILSYLKLTDCKVGLLVNFKVDNFKYAVKRFVI